MTTHLPKSEPKIEPQDLRWLRVPEARCIRISSNALSRATPLPTNQESDLVDIIADRTKTSRVAFAKKVRRFEWKDLNTK